MNNRFMFNCYHSSFPSYCLFISCRLRSSIACCFCCSWRRHFLWRLLFLYCWAQIQSSVQILLQNLHPPVALICWQDGTWSWEHDNANIQNLSVRCIALHAWCTSALVVFNNFGRDEKILGARGGEEQVGENIWWERGMKRSISRRPINHIIFTLVVSTNWILFKS